MDVELYRHAEHLFAEQWRAYVSDDGGDVSDGSGDVSDGSGDISDGGGDVSDSADRAGRPLCRQSECDEGREACLHRPEPTQSVAPSEVPAEMEFSFFWEDTK